MPEATTPASTTTTTETAPQAPPTPEQATAAPATAPAPTPEAKPDPAPAPDPMAAKFAALARKDKEARAREAALAEKEAALAARLKKAEQIESVLQKRDEDPLAVFDALGIEIDKFADKLIEGPPKKKDPTLSAVETLQKQIEELKAERAKEAEQFAATRRAEAVAKYQKEIADTITKTADKFELVNERQATPLVYAVIEQNYEQTGALMPIEEAAAMVEAALEKEAKESVSFLKSTKSKKIQALLQAEGFTAAEAKKIADAAAGTTPATQTPADSGVITDDGDDRPLTTEDWLKAAEEVDKKSMVLTNDVNASLPKYTLVKNDMDDFQKALEMLQYSK